MARRKKRRRKKKRVVIVATPPAVDSERAETQKSTQAKPHQQRSGWLTERGRRIWSSSWLKPGWKLILKIIGLLAVGITFYSVRPVLSVTSLAPSDLHANNGLKASVSNSGMLTIKNVTVQCVINKVIFDNSYTLELIRYALLNEYSVPDVTSGETFTADCGFTWSMWMKDTDGFFMLGNGVAPAGRALGIFFSINKGIPTPNAWSTWPRAIVSTVGYANHAPTEVDGSFIIRYSWPLSWLPQQKLIHVIASRGTEGLKWRVAPESEPVIRDGDGFKFIAKGTGKDFGITMKRVN